MNEQALKQKIKNIAETKNKTYQQIWRDLILERLLVRISQSKYDKKLIFKAIKLLNN